MLQACTSGRRPWARPWTGWRDYVSGLVWECLGQEEDVPAEAAPPPRDPRLEWMKNVISKLDQFLFFEYKFMSDLK